MKKNIPRVFDIFESEEKKNVPGVFDISESEEKKNVPRVFDISESEVEKNIPGYLAYPGAKRVETFGQLGNQTFFSV